MVIISLLWKEEDGQQAQPTYRTNTKSHVTVHILKWYLILGMINVLFCGLMERKEIIMLLIAFV